MLDRRENSALEQQDKWTFLDGDWGGNLVVKLREGVDGLDGISVLAALVV
jgi:hypothetical protein